jgi:hypothetical protein
MTRYLLLLDSYGLVFVGHPLWREEGSVFCICCWPLLAQSFSGPSPFVLATIFYSLRFETSLFVASYDSQGHGGGIWPRLPTGVPEPNQLSLIHVQSRNGHASQKTYHVSIIHRYVTSPRAQKTQPPLTLRAGPCLQSCCLATRWSNFSVAYGFIQEKNLFMFSHLRGLTWVLRSSRGTLFVSDSLLALIQFLLKRLCPEVDALSLDNLQKKSRTDEKGHCYYYKRWNG